MSASEKCPTPRLVPIRLRVPAPLLEAVDEVARRCGVSRSDAVRALLVAVLTRRSQWPPGADEDGGGRE